MDEMKIVSKFTRGIISKALKMVIHKKTGYDIDIQLNKVTTTIADGKTRNRVAYYNNECECGWLRNATKKEFSAACFAGVGSRGLTYYCHASGSVGVRPEIWLVK